MPRAGCLQDFVGGIEECAVSFASFLVLRVRHRVPAVSGLSFSAKAKKGDPQGLPMDMRVCGDGGSIGGLYNGWAGWRNKDEDSKGIYTTEQLEENARVMKNNGYYSAPRSLFWGE